MRNWKPSAALTTQIERGAMYESLRDWFRNEGVLEVETPVLGAFGVTDPSLSNLEAHSGITGKRWYLQTSPEYAMKRLLAAGIGDCYQIQRAFRDEEIGRYHQPEFSLLEWYRTDYDLAQIVTETLDLVRLGLNKSPEHVEYQYADLFAEATGHSIFDTHSDELAAHCRELGMDASLARDAQLEFLLDTLAVKAFPKNRLTVITHYPASQAALARLDTDDPRTALRFEVFMGSVELANGFVELTDATEQAHRFARDNQARRNRGLAEQAVDEDFLAALRDGLGECAGVALGLDRLLMQRLDLDHIDQAVTFAHAP